jgi:hypothetical protein
MHGTYNVQNIFDFIEHFITFKMAIKSVKYTLRPMGPVVQINVVTILALNYLGVKSAGLN